MKKFICAMLVATASLMNADALLNAIKKHDVHRVTVLLKQNKYDPSLYVLYINSAREMVEKCRNDLFLQRLSPAMDHLYKAFGMGFMVSSLYPLCAAIQMDFHIPGKIPAEVKEELSKSFGLGLLGLICFSFAAYIRDGEIETAYNESLEIQELILQFPYG